MYLHSAENEENIGRLTQAGDPVACEVRALYDIERATGARPGYARYDHYEAKTVASRVFQFFASRAEVLQVVSELMLERGVHVAAHPGLSLRDLIAIRDPVGLSRLPPEAWRIYVIELPVAIDEIDRLSFSPSQLGWIDVDLPTLEDGALTMAVVGTKAPPKKPPSRDLYNELKMRFRKLRTGHVLLRNFVYSGERDCPDIALLPGAAAFAAQGGELMQRWVKNNRFVPVRD